MLLSYKYTSENYRLAITYYLYNSLIQIMKSLLRIYFIIILLNLILVSCIFFTKFENIARSKVQPQNYTTAVSYINGFLITSLIMLSIQMIIMLVGIPFAKQPFALQIIFQILGVILYGLYILLRMPYQTISYIWGVFCLIPFIISVASLIYKSVGFRKYSALDYSADNPKKIKTQVQI